MTKQDKIMGMVENPKKPIKFGSLELIPFQERNIRMLKDIKDIVDRWDPELDLRKGEIVQLNAYTDLTVSVGCFGNGNGMGYDITEDNFRENIDYEIIKGNENDIR